MAGYPSWRYHHSKAALIVKNADDEADRAPKSDGWCDSPADTKAPEAEKPPVVEQKPGVPPPDGAGGDVDVLDQNVTNVSIAVAEMTDESELYALLAREEAGKNRKMVIAAITLRIEELQPQTDGEGHASHG